MSFVESSSGQNPHIPYAVTVRYAGKNKKERLKANNKVAGRVKRRTRATRKRVQSLEEAAAQARKQNITYGKLMEQEQTKESDRAMRERMERWKCLQKQQRNILS